jgi:hypothetical protein
MGLRREVEDESVALQAEVAAVCIEIVNLYPFLCTLKSFMCD